MTIRSLPVLGLLVAVMLVGRCDAFAEETDAAMSLPEPVLVSLRGALESYEAARGDLAADRLASASAPALADAFRLTTEDRGLDATVLGFVDQAVVAADALVAAEDLAAARTAFGEISRQLLLLADHDPRLIAGWYVFVCPMAEPFGQWLQPTEALDNPYMGTAMPKCGSAVDRAVVAQRPAAPATEPAATNEPTFEPGIPHLTMVDVRDHKFLWRELEQLQVWERGDRISIREYRSKAIEKTAHFLQLDETAAADFTTAAYQNVGHLRDAARQGRLAAEATGGSASFSADLGAAVASLTAFLGEAPRHQLFAPDCKKWLLKLAFSPAERKESREAELASSGR